MWNIVKICDEIPVTKRFKCCAISLPQIRVQFFRHAIDMPSFDVLRKLAYVKNVSTSGFFTVELDF